MGITVTLCLGALALRWFNCHSVWMVCLKDGRLGLKIYDEWEWVDVQAIRHVRKGALGCHVMFLKSGAPIVVPSWWAEDPDVRSLLLRAPYHNGTS